MLTPEYHQKFLHVRAPDKNGGGSLFDAIATNNKDHALLAIQKDPSCVNQLCWDASIHALNTALGAAVRWKNVEMTVLLLRHGADPSQHLLNNKTPLLWGLLDVHQRLGAKWPASLLDEEKDLLWPMLDQTQSLLWPTLPAELGLFWAAETRRYPSVKIVIDGVCALHRAQHQQSLLRQALTSVTDPALLKNADVQERKGRGRSKM